MIELARAQDEEVGDGTTSVIILAGEMLSVAEPFFLKELHPTIIVNAYYKALEDALLIADSLVHKIDTNNELDFSLMIKSCLGTKFSSKWNDLLSNLALKAVKITHNKDAPHFDCDIKKYAKVEKIPGGTLDECKVLDGIIINKDLVHPQMRKEIKNPRVLLLDCNLEYKKGESMTNIEFTKENELYKFDLLVPILWNKKEKKSK
jgi:T-complex protein 1 subunit gamma